VSLGCEKRQCEQGSSGFALYEARTFYSGSIANLTVRDGGPAAELRGGEARSFVSYGRGNIRVLPDSWLALTYIFSAATGHADLRLVLVGEGHREAKTLLGPAVVRGNSLNCTAQYPAHCVRRLLYHVEPGTQSIFVGYLMQGSGNVVVEPIEIMRGIPASRSLHTPVRNYVRQAIHTAADLSLYADQRDWSAVETVALAHLDEHASLDDAHAILSRVLAGIGDNHSRLDTGEVAAYPGATDPGDGPPFEATVERGIAVITVSGRATFPSSNTAGANRLRGAVLSVAAHVSRGWIVDLSSMAGGDMWGTLYGLCPLLGTPTPGSFIDSHASVHWWHCDDIGFAVSDSFVPRPPADAPGASDSNETASLALPVAVIASRATSSGGENVVIAFHGRAKTRFFGAQTAGLTSSNQAADLPDGARLVVASGWPRDRDGRVYQTAIKPDQETCGQCSPIEEAKRWLEATAEPQWPNSK
jgi:carboxyl-terminal processing protease